jgi:ubiquinone/menaquinone biosynthesis C-methylase UbiE
MNTAESDKLFSGSIPKLYDDYLVPLIFQPYAQDLVGRLASRKPARVLEIAAGTGVVTRLLASTLPASAAIVATDLNRPMLELAAAVGTSRPVQWREADAMQLPFGDGEFDAVLCQFGVMFFPDKPKAFAEAHRVLKPGGLLLFNAWDRIEENEFADTVTTALATLFPGDAPRFMARTPHGYHDAARIARDLQAGGFGLRPRLPAIAYCQGTPLRNEIESRGPGRLAQATDLAEAALALRFGAGPVDGKIQAHVVAVERASNS